MNKTASDKYMRKLASNKNIKTVYFNERMGTVIFSTNTSDITSTKKEDDVRKVEDINSYASFVEDIFIEKGFIPVTNAINYEDRDVADMMSIFEISSITFKGKGDPNFTIEIEKTDSSYKLSFLCRRYKLFNFFDKMNTVYDEEFKNEILLYGSLNIQGFSEAYQMYENFFLKKSL